MRLTRPDDTPRNRATRVACVADDCARVKEPIPGFGIATRMFPLPDGYADLDAPAGTFYCRACGDAKRVTEEPLPVTLEREPLP